MSQRGSGYKRRRNDSYQTPPWVTQVLIPHLKCRVPLVRKIWEPAAGKGQMAKTLSGAGFQVVASDLSGGRNFLKSKPKWLDVLDAIITNPPFDQAEEFIEHAIRMTKQNRGMVAMLTRIDYDSASTRRGLFQDNPMFAKKIVLTRRIVWFKKKGAAPSYNHCWLIWDWRHNGPATIAYGQ